MNVRLSAPRPTKASPGATHPGKPLITIIAIADILSYPERMAQSVMLQGDYAMRQGNKMYSFYGTSSKQDGSFEGQGEEDAITITQKFIAEHPGDEVESENFAQEWMGVPCIIIRDFCDGSLPKHYGSECAPLQMTPGFTANAEKTGYLFTFQAFLATSLLPGRGPYTFITQDPTVVTDNGALALNEVNGPHYLLASDATGETITVATNTLPNGALVTLIGSGGTTPSVLSAGTGVLLKSGANWTALQGARITLKVFNGGAEKYLIEETRS